GPGLGHQGGVLHRPGVGARGSCGGRLHRSAVRRPPPLQRRSLERPHRAASGRGCPRPHAAQRREGDRRELAPERRYARTGGFTHDACRRRDRGAVRAALSQPGRLQQLVPRRNHLRDGAGGTRARHRVGSVSRARRVPSLRQRQRERTGGQEADATGRGAPARGAGARGRHGHRPADGALADGRPQAAVDLGPHRHRWRSAGSGRPVDGPLPAAGGRTVLPARPDLRRRQAVPRVETAAAQVPGPLRDRLRHLGQPALAVLRRPDGGLPDLAGRPAAGTRAQGGLEQCRRPVRHRM
ncbi:MAG: amidohydrolase 2, partial [uncultured Ramlibacter sp.]